MTRSRLQWALLVVFALAGIWFSASPALADCGGVSEPPCPPPSTPPSTNPGLYVQVLDGTINLANGGGSQNFTAGQFGFTPGFTQPPVILPNNPGLQFTPPPSFSSGTGGNGSGGGKPGNVDCIVRFAPEIESDVVRKASEAFSGLAYSAPANGLGTNGLTAQNTAPPNTLQNTAQWTPPPVIIPSTGNVTTTTVNTSPSNTQSSNIQSGNFCDYAPDALAGLTTDASGGLRVGMYGSPGPAAPVGAIDAYGLGGASVTRANNLGVTDTAGLFAPGTPAGFRDSNAGGSLVATYGVRGLPANQQLSLSGMFTYQRDDFTLTSFAGASNPASARTDSYGFAGSAIYSVGQNYLVGSAGYKFGNGNESVSVNGSTGSFDTRGYWADLKLGHVFVLADTITWGYSPG